MTDDLDPAQWDALVRIFVEAALFALVTLLASITEEQDNEGQRHFVLRANILTKLIPRCGIAYLVAELIYRVADSIKAAGIAWLIVFWALKGLLPLVNHPKTRSTHS